MSNVQVGLDQAYENGAYIVGADEFVSAWVRNAAAFRKATPCDLDVPYGDHPRATYDMFWPKVAPKGLMVFVHGGYWKARSKSDWSHFAQGGLLCGYAVGLIGYPLAPEVRIGEITNHVARAIEMIAEQVEGPIVLAGHSAGGHLVGRMVMADVLRQDVLNRIAQVMPISPVGDLRPLIELSLNDDLKLDEGEAMSESPTLGAKTVDVPVAVVVGAEERPAFLDQASELAKAWNSEHIVLSGRHHFDVIDPLCDAGSQLMRKLIPKGQRP